MENRKFKHFKDDIRKTFTLYALIPVIIITFSSYMLSLFIWYRTVIRQNSTINNDVSKRVESVVSSYLKEAYTISEQSGLMKDIYSRDNSFVYQKLYSFVNTSDVRSNFFIFDKDMNPIISSTENIPEYAQKKNAFLWGITARMTDTPDTAVIEKQFYDNNSRHILSIGKAIVRNGQISGYVIFDLDERNLTSIIGENFSVDVVLTDKYTNVISTTNELITNRFGKIDDIFKDKTGFIGSGSSRHYMTKSSIIDGDIYVYTITSTGYMTSLFLLAALLLIILFAMLAGTMHLSAKKIASSKTKSIDEIIKGISNVQNGNLDTSLNINTRDEFQIIAEAYNKMLIDIKNLIELNKEKARENIISEIKQLESQFDPHFLFNTLEMIRYMCIMDPPSVNKVIVSLSTLLRCSINNDISYLSLGKDVEYTKNYLLIQKYRFGERLNYSINLEEGTEDCIVPKLIVQPIIENAIKYGFGDRMELTVDIDAGFVEDNLIIHISNNGVGMEPEQFEKIQTLLTQHKNDSSHIGLFNVHRRIQLMYGNNYGLKLENHGSNGITVSLILPINRSENYVESINC